MDIKSFMESGWVKRATDPQTVARVVEDFPKWILKLQDTDLVSRARRLWQYLTSGQCSYVEVAMVVGALLYLVTPVDGVPDFIPVVGWMDDMALAGMVLGYLDRKAAINKVEDIPV
jgi:uncharacterized membrane protein YkvA (DUF1232 family)